jgi:hypothetical protein
MHDPSRARPLPENNAVASAAAPVPIDEADSHLSVSFAESRAASGAKFCFAVAADRACDPAASACCSERSPTKKLGLREFRLAVGVFVRLQCLLPAQCLFVCTWRINPGEESLFPFKS